MLIIEHRVNNAAGLAKVPKEHGVEIDVRHDNRTGRMYLNHDPGIGEDLEDYLKSFNHAFVIFNIKEAGIEKSCMELAAKYNISPEKYFLLDVEFPFLYATTRGTRADKLRTSKIAVRYSEAEPVEMTIAQKGFVDWVWIDTNNMLPLNSHVSLQLMEFKTCLVSPDRWRPDRARIEIPAYRRHMADLGFRLDAVMVGKEFVDLWK